MWQVRVKVRVPAINWEGTYWLMGQAPLGRVWFQLAATMPAMLGFDLEVAVK